MNQTLIDGFFFSLFSPPSGLSWFSDASGVADATGSSDDQPPPPRAPDEGRDLLTCGQCSQAFPLAHILAFIQHKQGGCRSRNQAPNVNTTPPSPANRAQQRVTNTEPGAGFIELRRGATRERVWGEDPGVKLEPSKAGECLEKEAGKKGRLLISDSVFLLYFFLSTALLFI